MYSKARDFGVLIRAHPTVRARVLQSFLASPGRAPRRRRTACCSHWPL